MHGRPIVISQFKAMVQGAAAEAEGLLWRELMRTDRFEVPLHKVVDDVSFTKRGESFVNENNGLHNGTGAGARVGAEERAEIAGRGVADAAGAQVSAARRRVSGAAAVLDAQTGAARPARGTEIMTIRHRNGRQPQDRNVFVMDGQVLFVTRYHKSQSQWDRPKVVPRFLPPRVGQLLAVYLVHLQPFRELLTVGVFWATGRPLVVGLARAAEYRLARVLKRR